MINLAGNLFCDRIIRKELSEAGIEIIQLSEPVKTEVPYSIFGKLGDIIFKRAWYYYIVSCHIPLTIAEQLYENEIGKRDIRVAGHCGCPPPRKWLNNGFIDLYHIDSQKGLSLFVKTVS